MKELLSVVRCITPYFIVTAMLYPFAAVIGGSWDAFMWERYDRVFFFVCSLAFGWMLMLRVLYVSGEDYERSN